ncbi:arylacetamide deacetylase [Plakobranchus ocellatus]|uniref:Arylacetamide deacetylase n=1 Tax=Plakobranchus ocellatus TaxID=259542 RepID=A0AAV4A5L2_9GAST|nr:arylacetamide deacetylase [Plakobranchus ocellatus]
MILRAVALTTAVFVALFAYVFYTPLPAGLEDRYRAMLVIGMAKMLALKPFELTEWLGYGSAFDNIEMLQREVDPSVPPMTASFGDLDVSRDKIAGIDVIIYRPKDVSPGELLPGLVYFHGGGWVTGDIGILLLTWFWSMSPLLF